MRAPATNLFNGTSISSVISSRSATSYNQHNSALDYGGCRWYLTAPPRFDRYFASFWVAAGVTVVHKYYKKEKLSYTEYTDTIYSNASLTEGWIHNISTDIVTQSFYNNTLEVNQHPDRLVITFNDSDSDTITLTFTMPIGASARRHFDFNLHRAEWNTFMPGPDEPVTEIRIPFITELIVVLGSTDCDWYDIYEPIVTNEELMEDSGVSYVQVIDRYSTPNYADKTTFYNSYMFDEWDDDEQDYVEVYYYGAYVQYTWIDDGYIRGEGRIFPVKSNVSQTYSTSQSIRYADIDFDADFDDPSGSW